MKKIVIGFVIFIVVCLFCWWPGKKMSICEIDEMFDTKFSEIGLFREQDTFRIFGAPIYRMKGSVSNDNRFILIEVSEDNCINVNPIGGKNKMKRMEEVQIDNLTVRVKLFSNGNADAPSGYYVPYIVIEFCTDTCFIGVLIHSNYNNLYKETDSIKVKDFEFVEWIVNLILGKTG